MIRSTLARAFLAALGMITCGLPAVAGTPTTSDRCGDCHTEIYRTWRNSAHAKSMEDPFFLVAYREIEERDGKAGARLCLTCHAPLTAVNADWDLEYRVTWEGVNCEVCHGIAGVDLSGTNPEIRYEIGDVKRGPIEDAASGEHGVAYSPLHSTSEVCAACHEFTTDEGTPLMTTYTEWKESEAAANGVHCQSCHMSRTRGNVVDPRVARVSHAEINLHEVPGGHSLDQLQKALLVTLRPERRGDTLDVAVELKNKGAGHAVPTGMPARRVILEVEVRGSTGETFAGERVYGKIFADAEGQPIKDDSRLFAPGVQLVSDTRIAAGERRTERFRFPLTHGATAYVRARLHYEHAPTTADESTALTFYSESRTLPASR